MTVSSRSLLTEIARSLPNLKTLRLERVMPWLSDDDLLLLSQSVTGLQSLSLLGCQLLTNSKFLTSIDGSVVWSLSHAECELDEPTDTVVISF